MSRPSSMDSMTSTLSFYEVPGHVAPGGAFLLCVFLFEFWAREVGKPLGATNGTLHTPLYTGLTFFSGALDKPTDLVVGIMFLVCLLVLAYVLGHILVSLSSFLISRVFDSQAHDYPYTRILGMETEDRNKLSRPFYRGMFFWLNFYLLLRYLPFLSYSGILPPWIASASNEVAAGLIRLLGCVVLVKPLASVHYQQNQQSRWVTFIRLPGIRHALAVYSFLVIKVFPVPYQIIEKMLSHYAERDRKLEPEILAEYKRLFQQTFGLDPDTARSDNYWLSYLFVRHHSDATSALTNRLLRLYGLARNLSTSLFLAFVYAFLWILLNGKAYTGWHGYEVQAIVLLPLGFFLSACLMLFRYYFLKTPRYNKLVFRSFVFLRRSQMAMVAGRPGS